MNSTASARLTTEQRAEHEQVVHAVPVEVDRDEARQVDALERGRQRRAGERGEPAGAEVPGQSLIYVTPTTAETLKRQE